MKINIPESLNEITIKQFFDFKKCCEENQDEKYLRLAIISIFCDISFEEVKRLSAKDFNEISDHLKLVIETKPTHVEKFVISGKKFGFIPNLDEISAGEYIDLDELFKNEESYLEQMALMYRPIKQEFGNSYNIEPYIDYNINKDIMQFAPISAYLGSKVFFCNLLSELLSSFQDFLQSESREVMDLEEALILNGVGINQFIQSLEEISLNLTMQQEKICLVSLPF